MKLTLKIRLISDTTFGRGDGVSGLIDQEIEYDTATGLPFIRGRTLKGLLVEECANILYVLPDVLRLQEAARRLFGQGGSTLADGGNLRVGTAHMPEELRRVVRDDIAHNRCRPPDVLEMFTTIRRQTAVDELTGVPSDGSLRSTRVLLRDIELASSLDLSSEDDDAIALLCACTAGLRRGGVARNRGSGRIQAHLEEIDTSAFLDYFEQIARGQIA